MTEYIYIQQYQVDHGIISSPELSEASSSPSPDLRSLRSQSEVLDEINPNLQGFNHLINLKYEPVGSDWSLWPPQYALLDDSSWVKSPITSSCGEWGRPQNSIISLDSHTNLIGSSPPSKSQGTPKDKKNKPHSLACPFYRSNPLKYYKCQKYDLQRIKDVKQHIHRKHVKPDFYCARCYEVFVDATSRDAHIREGTCNIQDDPQFEGITDTQKGELKDCHKRGKEIVEQWYLMWDILFQGEPRPSSIYIGNYLEEMGPLIRAFWQHKRSEIITNSSPPISQDVFDQVMDIVLVSYELESAKAASSTELKQKNRAQIQCEMPGSADTTIAAQIGIPNVVQDVEMMSFNCLPANFNTVTNGAINDHTQCLPGSDLEVAFNFDNFDQGFPGNTLVNLNHT